MNNLFITFDIFFQNIFLSFLGSERVSLEKERDWDRLDFN